MNKKITILITLVVSSFQIGFGQQAIEPQSGFIYPEYMGVSRPLSDFFVNEEEVLNAQTVFKESKDKEHRTPQTFQFTAEDGPEYGNDESTIQKEQGNRSVFAPLTNWAGQTGGGSCPPDPSGAAGPNHYVQAVNATPFKVFNKNTGATMGTIKQIGSLWNPDTDNMGDPIILYDKYADRWFVSQFGQGETLTGSGSSGSCSNCIHIAISTTNDPTGTYYTYTYSSPQFPDYLKFSIWADGYYMTANTSTDRVFVFERDKMILGQNARAVFNTFNTGNVSGFFLPMPADADGVLPPVGTACPFFWYTENSWGGGNVDGIKYINATVNWVPNTPTITFSSTTTIPTAAFDGTYNSQWNDIRQSTSSSTLLDGIGGIIWYRAQWRQWTGYNTVVLCWGVKISSTQRSIKWVELRQTQPSGAWTLYQEGIYAPDALNRWVGSIAMDDNGSIALAYAAAGPTPTATSVGLRYTGRLATDPLGQMTFAETVAFTGSGNMSQCSNRFGDYSQTSLDPNGTTFWHTGQYVLNGGPATRIYSFNLPLPTELKEAKSELNYNVYQNGNALLVNADHLTESGQFVVDLFDVQGRKIDGQIVTANDNKIRTSFDVNNFAKGIYMVRIGKANTSFQKVIKVPIN
jgi:hypothetical protein